MKFLPYLALLVSFAAGYVGLPFIVFFAMAILSALMLYAPRRRQLREQPQAPDQNMLVDGAFLIFQQTLIHFILFALGLFIAHMVSG